MMEYGRRSRTQKRDRKAKKELNILGWRVITIWECELNSKIG